MGNATRKPSEGWGPLTKFKVGSVNVELIGSRVGPRSGYVNTYRWRPSPKEAGKWEKAPLRRRDVQDLAKATAQLAKWDRDEEESEYGVYRRSKNV